LLLFLYTVSFRILFRDLKPENCARSQDRVVKLFDFGLAKELKAVDAMGYSDLYKATGLTGTLRIMAPEVVECRAYGLQADVYSFGIVMYEIFAGERCQLTAAEICKGQRPKVPSHMGRPFSDWLQACWLSRFQDRPTMEQLCKQIELEYERLAPSSMSSSSSSPEQQQQ
jgi:serine/threonine protein kinase